MTRDVLLLNADLRVPPSMQPLDRAEAEKLAGLLKVIVEPGAREVASLETCQCGDERDLFALS